MQYDPKLDENPPIPDKLYDLILKNGFITGSKVFGGWHPVKSDIDVCLPPVRSLRFDDLAELGWADLADYDGYSEFRCVYLKTNKGHVLNVLCFNAKQDWIEWRTVTKQFIRMLNASKRLSMAVAREKKVRTQMFELLRYAFYGYTQK